MFLKCRKMNRNNHNQNLLNNIEMRQGEIDELVHIAVDQNADEQERANSVKKLILLYSLTQHELLQYRIPFFIIESALRMVTNDRRFNHQGFYDVHNVGNVGNDNDIPYGGRRRARKTRTRARKTRARKTRARARKH
jgi:hypothetical protein